MHADCIEPVAPPSHLPNRPSAIAVDSLLGSDPQSPEAKVAPPTDPFVRDASLRAADTATGSAGAAWLTSTLWCLPLCNRETVSDPLIAREGNCQLRVCSIMCVYVMANGPISRLGCSCQGRCLDGHQFCPSTSLPQSRSSRQSQCGLRRRMTGRRQPASESVGLRRGAYPGYHTHLCFVVEDGSAVYLGSCARLRLQRWRGRGRLLPSCRRSTIRWGRRHIPSSIRAAR